MLRKLQATLGRHFYFYIISLENDHACKEGSDIIQNNALSLPLYEKHDSPLTHAWSAVFTCKCVSVFMT